MIKKLTLLAMAIGALVALAGPASASANWTEEGVEITENHTLEVTGTLGFTGPAGLGSPGISCLVKASIQLTAGTDQAHVLSVEFEKTGSGTPDCVGTGSFYTCHVQHATAENLPWTATPTGSSLTIQGGKLRFVYKPGSCLASESVVADTGEADKVTGEADNQEAVSESTNQLNDSCMNCHRVYRGRNHCVKP